MELTNTNIFVYVLVWQHERDGERDVETHVYDSLESAQQGKNEIVDDINESEDGYFNGFKENCFDNWAMSNEDNGFYIFDLSADENGDFISIKKTPIETLTK
mgnify:CR=1 FL=1